MSALAAETKLRAIPPRVVEWCRSVMGTKVVYVAPMGAFDGIVDEAEVEGKRIKYKIRDANGNTRIAYADQVAHTWQKEINGKA